MNIASKFQSHNAKFMVEALASGSMKRMSSGIIDESIHVSLDHRVQRRETITPNNTTSHTSTITSTTSPD
ncbi:hypothetical protein HI914_05185 [Erysiphe necator]|nr:hypothetical protein HI914_05185 [Erysiphe necator]